MENRLNFFEEGKNALRPLYAFGAFLKKSSIDVNLRELIDLRISQINGCAYCIDIHYKNARSQGESEQRLYGLSAWRETSYYTERERAALEWAEAITRCELPDNVYNAVSQYFSQEELIDLTMVCIGINNWNRINIAFPSEPGSYQVGQFE